MNRLLFLCLCALLLGSCGVVRKKTTYGSRHQVTVPAPEGGEGIAEGATPTTDPPSETSEVFSESEMSSSGPAQVDAIIQTALDYTGTRYKYGGTTKKGMDCSGLLYVAFRSNDVEIPRVSHEMADQGKRIKMSKVQKGDLLFFKTTRKGKRINHVGLVIEVQRGDVKFIHSTTSRGVIVSSLREGYWNYSFVKATRVF